ncbi:hypothetical protein RHMOL_Rhmol13G0120200 [Rhododendron molle]|uniref:Uncharacterized protein n=1 Tax=Rhododendron molle TaxID=49168 RepID=A0ACC0L5S1_RHOML|nr:hypothetical protein RHMOL_Rhmol13G0120200 [Rhododendron molle]
MRGRSGSLAYVGPQIGVVVAFSVDANESTIAIVEGSTWAVAVGDRNHKRRKGYELQQKVTKQAREARDVQFLLFDDWRVCFIPPPEEPEE